MSATAQRRSVMRAWLLLPVLFTNAYAAEPTAAMPASRMPADGVPVSQIAPTEPPNRLAGCTASLSPPLVTLHCPGPLLLATFVARGSWFDVVQGGMSILEVSSAIVDEVPRRDGAPLKVFVAPHSLGGVVATAAERGAGTAEFISCSPQGDRCNALLVELADRGLPDLRPYISDWVDPEPWLGMKLAVPPGCYPQQFDGMSGFACGMDSLSGLLVRGADLDPKHLLAETMKARAEAAKANGTAMTQTPIDCQIAGTQGACALTTRPPHTPFDAPHDVVGYARLTDRSVVLANCRWAGEASAAPEFCGQMVVFK